jgi:hypothetical protein
MWIFSWGTWWSSRPNTFARHAESTLKKEHPGFNILKWDISPGLQHIATLWWWLGYSGNKSKPNNQNKTTCFVLLLPTSEFGFEENY